ncbi:hypothetical protein, partial [Vibrio aestuarianus]|uniref:hypothetical protein n=1 Tax=Vibrio aestuarianus TaxID=28171 RepID=UPI00237D1BFA
STRKESSAASDVYRDSIHDVNIDLGQKTTKNIKFMVVNFLILINKSFKNNGFNFILNYKKYFNGDFVVILLHK